jgi:hypothetical protein
MINAELCFLRDFTAALTLIFISLENVGFDFWRYGDSWGFVHIFCLNQDVQDLRIYRMWFDVYIFGFIDLIICLNQDVQDLRIYRMWFDVYIFGFIDLIICLNQDIQDLRMYRMWFDVYIFGFIDLII